MKRYSVFVSSTYKDLIEERQQVIQALLELDCIPIGMELFPATDDDQWTLIKNLIDDADYFILISAGKYGSIGPDGNSYTQMEYEYALSTGVPIINFLHKNISNIPAKFSETQVLQTEKLLKFRNNLELKMVKYWETPQELGSVVSRSLMQLIRSKPRQGWVKSNTISSEESLLEILQLKEKNAELQQQLRDFRNYESEELSRDEDEFSFDIQFMKTGEKFYERKSFSMSWNEIFKKPFAILLKESSEKDLEDTVNMYLLHVMNKPEIKYSKILIIKDDFNQILIQFLALNYIEESIKKRPVSDKNIYWKLSDLGIKKLTQIRAIKRSI